MDQHIIVLIVVGVIALLLGFLAAKLLEKNSASKTIKEAKKNAASILKEGW